MFYRIPQPAREIQAPTHRISHNRTPLSLAVNMAMPLDWICLSALRHSKVLQELFLSQEPRQAVALPPVYKVVVYGGLPL